MRACSRSPVGLLFRLLVLTAVAGTTACSGSVSRDDVRSAGEVMAGLTVAGEPGSAPSVRMRTPLTIDETTTAVTVPGSGEPIQVDQLFVIELSLYDARTGKKAASTYDTGKALAAKSSDDSLFPVLSEALVGLREGSRLVVAATAADAYGSGGVPPKGIKRTDPVVVVADVVAVPPKDVLPPSDGTAVSHVMSAPDVLATDGVPSAIDFNRVTPPPELTAHQLFVGTGPVVQDHDLVAVHYLGQRSSEKVPFEGNFFKEPTLVAIGTDSPGEDWVEQLVGVRQGSRLIIYEADRRGMIAWVVDVLGVN